MSGAARGAHVLALLASVGACGAPPLQSEADAPPPATAASGLPSERWLPLEHGTILRYETQTRAGPGVVVLRVVRASPSEGQLVGPSGTRLVRYAPDGVVGRRGDGSDAYLLRLPVATSTPAWPGSLGGTAHVAEVDLVVTTPAGRFEGCARVVEERGGDDPFRMVTTFCPGAGIVQMDGTTRSDAERATLAFRGPPIDIGPDGVERVK